MNGSTKNVLRIRQEFLTRAISRVKAMVVRGEPEEVNAAVDDVVRYFSWVKGNFSLDVQERLALQIHDLREVAKNLGNDLRRSNPHRPKPADEK